MRIAYLTDIDLTEESGVLTKHLMQCKNWHELGHQVKVFNIPPTTKKQSIIRIIDHEIFFSKILPVSQLSLSLFLNKLFVVNKVIDSLRLFKTDVIYLRSTTWFPGLERIVAAFPTVIEFNSVLEKEMKLMLSNKMQFIHKIGKDLLYRKAAGYVGVTREISDYYGGLYRRPTITIANGYDMARVKDTENKSDNIRPQLIFVGTPGYSWHGVDLFLRAATLIPEFDFHLIGDTIENVKLDNFFQYGFLQRDELELLYPKMDIGVGSLALFRKSMIEASPLKVREYCAYGLPVIIGYKDTDLSGKNYVLEIDNSPDGIEQNIDRIRAFVLAWKNKRVSYTQVADVIDYQKKEAIRIDFFKQIVHSKRIPSQ